MTEANILLVEDNEINQDLVVEVLTRVGYEVSIANNGQEALDLLERQPFKAVLMDLKMPVMDGYEAIVRIRQNPEYEKLPVIAISAVVQQIEIDKALNSGFDFHLGKPLDFEKLYDLLDKVTGSHSQNADQTDSNESPAKSSGVTLDLEIAIKNHAYDESLLAKLLGEFYKYYESVDADIELLIAQNETMGAERLAHNIKGVAGSFGAGPLSDSARALESALSEKTGDYQSLLSGFSTELAKFLHEAKSFLKNQGS